MTRHTKQFRQVAVQVVHDERGSGSVTVPVAAALLAVLAMIGLGIDGARATQNVAHADAVAEEAARAGAQAIRQDALIGGRVEVDPVPAIQAAQAYLSAAGMTGTARIVGGDRIHVEVTTTTDTVLLGLIGYDTVSADGTGEALLVPTLDGQPVGGAP